MTAWTALKLFWFSTGVAVNLLFLIEAVRNWLAK